MWLQGMEASESWVRNDFPGKEEDGKQGEESTQEPLKLSRRVSSSKYQETAKNTQISSQGLSNRRATDYYNYLQPLLAEKK